MIDYNTIQTPYQTMMAGWLLVQLAQNVQFANALVPCLLINLSPIVMGNGFIQVLLLANSHTILWVLCKDL